jgi:hypothetical protein
MEFELFEERDTPLNIACTNLICNFIVKKAENGFIMFLKNKYIYQQFSINNDKNSRQLTIIRQLLNNY